MSVRSATLDQIRNVAAEQNKQLAPLSDDLSLLSCGLDSLRCAIVVSRLVCDSGIMGFPQYSGHFR